MTTDFDEFKRAKLLEQTPNTWSHKRGKVPNRGHPGRHKSE